MAFTIYQQLLIVSVCPIPAICTSHNNVIGGWATSKPMNGTCKSNIWWYGSIWNVSCRLAVPFDQMPAWEMDKSPWRGSRKFCTSFYICHPEIHFSEFIVNVFNWPSIALLKCPSRDSQILDFFSFLLFAMFGAWAQHQQWPQSSPCCFAPTFATDNEFSCMSSV